MTFSMEEIRSIIECCSKNDVTLFKSEDFEVQFKQVSEKPTELDYKPSQTEKITADSIIQTQSDLEEEVGFESKAEELSMLHLTDPMKYEELLSNPEMLVEFEEELDFKGM